MIEVRRLTKRYEGRPAVDGLTFDVLPGHVTGFVGPNGAGKSTTMRMVLGLDRPDAGAALVRGRRYVDLRRPLREVGALLEAGAWHRGRSAFHHLLALARTNRIPRSRVEEVIGLVGLGGVAGRRAGTMSLGMGQRLGIAAALLGDPPVLLLDEPTNGLDPDGIIWLRALLRRMGSEGRTVLVSSHLIAEMALTVDRVVVIGRGRLLADASVAEVVAGRPGGYVRVRTGDEGRLRGVLAGTGARVSPQGDGSLRVEGIASEAVAELAAASDVVLHELAVHAPSLEDAYLALTGATVDYRGHEGTRRTA